MDTKTGTGAGELSARPSAEAGNARRRRTRVENAHVRYFLPKPGTSVDKPELGQEMASEGEALIQAFKSGQLFYTLDVWKAVPEVNGSGSPMIVKQAVVRT